MKKNIFSITDIRNINVLQNINYDKREITLSASDYDFLNNYSSGKRLKNKLKSQGFKFQMGLF